MFYFKSQTSILINKTIVIDFLKKGPLKNKLQITSNTISMYEKNKLDQIEKRFTLNTNLIKIQK